MIVIDKKPVPIYEVECPECKSKIRYKKSEVHLVHITCPACGVSFWTYTVQPIPYDLSKTKEALNK